VVRAAEVLPRAPDLSNYPGIAELCHGVGSEGIPSPIASPRKSLELKAVLIACSEGRKTNPSGFRWS